MPENKEPVPTLIVPKFKPGLQFYHFTDPLMLYTVDIPAIVGNSDKDSYLNFWWKRYGDDQIFHSDDYYTIDRVTQLFKEGSWVAVPSSQPLNPPEKKEDKNMYHEQTTKPVLRDNVKLILSPREAETLRDVLDMRLDMEPDFVIGAIHNLEKKELYEEGYKQLERLVDVSSINERLKGLLK